MSFWFFIWIIVSSFILVFTGWVFYILVRQKKAWKAFCSAHGLRFEPNALSASPSLGGVYKGYEVAAFTSEFLTPGGRTTRKLTAVEVNLTSRMPFSGAVASDGMVNVVEATGFGTQKSITHKSWEGRGGIYRADSVPMMDFYLKAERLDAIAALFSIPNAWVMAVFFEDKNVLRIDLPDPLDTKEKITKLLNRMVKIAQTLEVDEQEIKELRSLELQPPAVASKNKVTDTNKLPLGEEEAQKISIELEVEE